MKQKSLTDLQVKEMLSLYQSTLDEKYLSPVLNHCEKVIDSLVHQYAKQGTLFWDDLHEIGRIQVYELSLTFEVTSSKKFTDFIASPIRHKMSEFITEYGCTVSRPRRSKTSAVMESLEESKMSESIQEEPEEPSPLLAALEEAIGTLTSHEQAIIRMSYGWGVSQCDDAIIAAKVHSTPQTIKSTRSLALRKLYYRVLHFTHPQK